MLAGHGLITGGALVAALSGHPALLMVPLLTTFGRAYGGLLFQCCNNTQHAAVQWQVPDYRLCCRTFIANPLVGFLYWRMNYHVEHHMYTLVLCYRLADLRREIGHDLPPATRGILATWRAINATQ
jgi:fatty acid desaturase